MPSHLIAIFYVFNALAAFTCATWSMFDNASEMQVLGWISAFFGWIGAIIARFGD